MRIETVSGRLVNVTKPLPEDILLQDIAWALSRIPRFAGHSITEVPYNVAQHSVYVATLVEELFNNTDEFEPPNEIVQSVSYVLQVYSSTQEILQKALLHDAHEAYTGDIPSPVKRIPELRETIKLIELRLDHAILTKCQLDEVCPEEKRIISYCDKLAQAIEVYQFMPSRGLNWNLPKPTLVRLQNFPAPKTAMQSYKDFLAHYEYLT